MIWKISEEDDKLIDLFYNSSLRIILKITYQDHVKTTELLQFASIELLSIEVWQWRCRSSLVILQDKIQTTIATWHWRKNEIGENQEQHGEKLWRTGKQWPSNHGVRCKWQLWTGKIDVLRRLYEAWGRKIDFKW